MRCSMYSICGSSMNTAVSPTSEKSSSDTMNVAAPKRSSCRAARYASVVASSVPPMQYPTGLRCPAPVISRTTSLADASMEAITFEDYMTEGPLTASDVVREITGAGHLNPVGYCIGGTLLATTLAYLAARQDERFGAATFMVSLLDFSEVGTTALFIAA